MEKAFKQAKWIWKRGETAYDDYAEFQSQFTCGTSEPVFLDVSADSNCNVYINGELAFFKQCADYPHYKLYDHVDITKYCKPENELRIAVWYYGNDSATYYHSTPGLIFEVSQGQACLLCSGESTKSRTDSRYKIGCCKEITGQLGFSFCYDNTMTNTLPWQNSVVVDKTNTLVKSPLKSLAMGEKTDFRILRQDNHCALVDLGREEVGFLSVELISPIEQTVTVTYGEHIADGCVRRKIGTRDFSVELHLAAGCNQYQNSFRRLAGRYLEIFYDQSVTIHYLGLVPVFYPTEVHPFTAENSLQQRIYDTAVRTLQLSMHEHYEDCPWREQAMYVLDSRNQMLCGYYCFDNAAYARQNLILMTKGQMADGLLELTYPARNTPAIPFFSLMYPIAVQEYVTYTGDRTILPEVMPAVEKILTAFRGRAKNGLVASLPYPYWNFYEWSDGSAHDDEITRSHEEPYVERFDLILNCAWMLTEESYGILAGQKADLTAVRQKIHETFFDERKGQYCASTTQRQLFTQLGNSMAILAGVAEGAIRDSLVYQLMQPNDMVPLTLSMLGFQYDALLIANSSNREYIIRDIEQRYGNMLNAGATSFWETEQGESDFEGAGSLCHGWSAIPVYYLHLLK